MGEETAKRPAPVTEAELEAWAVQAAHGLHVHPASVLRLINEVFRLRRVEAEAFRTVGALVYRVGLGSVQVDKEALAADYEITRTEHPVYEAVWFTARPAKEGVG